MASEGLERARQRLQKGDVAGAAQDCRRLLTSASSPAERTAVRLVMSACHERSGNLPAALDVVQSALRDTPDDPLVHYALAEIQEARGDKHAALASVARAVELGPRFIQGWHYYAVLLGEMGDAPAAVSAFRRVLEIDPNHARAWNNLGNVHRNLGEHEQAEDAFTRAVAARPDYALAAANLASLQRDRGEVERAEATARAALARTSGQPPFRPLLVLLAGLLRERGALDEAAQLYMRAIALAPEQSSGEWFHLGWVLGERGELKGAREAYARGRSSKPRDPRAALAQHLALPMVYVDSTAVEHARSEFARGIDAIDRELPAIFGGLSADQAIDGLRWTNFFLAYQGRDDRVLQERYAAVCRRVVAEHAPVWHEASARTSIAGRPIRIGFASAFFHVGTVGRYFRSWITELPRDRFQVFVYHLFPGMDEVAAAIEQRADAFRAFGGSRARPSVVAPVIRADALDLLVYPELGMDVTSFALAALRLAGRQVCAWGHPVTSGHATIDGFISCAAMEPADGENHYSERLITLPGIGTRYARPQPPSGVTRQQFNLPTDRVLLLCSQSLFKIHPDNDGLMAGVLADNPSAILVLFAGRHPAITDQFMRRLSRAFEERGMAIRERTRVLPQLGHDDFLGVNTVCDLMLDTLHWSGGNTSLDALACGLPVVTWPGVFMRGRQSAAMLGLLGVGELIASGRSDYLAIASRLIADGAWRSEMSRLILANQERVFDASEPLDELHRVFAREAGAA